MTEFLTENSPCGQNLLHIVSMGNAIIAEILRLKDYIPEVYRLETKIEQQKYGEIILDFSYLKISEVQDKKIEENPELFELDKQLRENYLELLTRFYLAFESTHQYATNLKQFIDELNEGYFIQQTMESVLQDNEGKQLMCEALYLFGVMLLVLDLHIPGIIRERLLISYYRYSADKSHGESNIDDVCKLLRSTGFSNAPGSKRVPNYPENYFGRFTFDQTYIDMVIGRLRSDDIYNQLSIYPHPDHRSSALSNQAGMLFICLYFSPTILHTQLSQMREITDKFFSDNWIISIYMGITVNLIDAWDNYKAAKQAIQTIIDQTQLKILCIKKKTDLDKILPKTYDILQEGILNETFVIQNQIKIINLIRDCNVLLKWYLLHTSLKNSIEFGGNNCIKKCKQINDLIINESSFNNTKIFELLLNTSQLELNIKDILKELLNEKLIRWNNYKTESYDRINELSDAFSLNNGIKSLSKIENSEQLKIWFKDTAIKINTLSLDKPNKCGNEIIQLIQALGEVQEFHNLESIMQVKQYLLETCKYLQLMLQLINIKENILINLQLISDLSYAWQLIDYNYTEIMQNNIKKQPKLVIKLRATFLKLSSALDIPLLRINQAHSDDLISVSKYYSTELANYIRKVVQIIPETMFEILSKIIKLQTEIIKEIPIRLEKSKLKEYAQLDERYSVAELTYSISIFTEGILMMKKTLVGVIELDPKQLLEDGIRKEIINNLSKTLHDGFTFNMKSNNRSQELITKLESLFKAIDGYRRSFEYIQDYLNINGLKILQEELSRLISYNVEKECNKFLNNKSQVQDWQSSYQNTTIPIPNYPSIDQISINFIGRLAREILYCTDPKTTIFWDLKDVWYERKTQKKEIFNYRIFKKIRLIIGPIGLIGLDKFYSYMFITDLQQNIEKVHKNFVGDKQWLEHLNQLTRDLEQQQYKIQQNPIKFYQTYTTKWTKVWPKILEWILDLGQKQILRKLIAYDLNNASRFHAKNLETSLETFNRALLNELQEHQLDSKKSCPSKELLSELNQYLEINGLYDPLQQIFITTKNSHYIPLFLFLFTISHTTKLQHSIEFNTLIAKKPNEPIDGAPIIYGIITILQQFHYKLTDLYLDYLCQYITSILESTLSIKQEWNAEVETVIYFLEIFIRTAKISRSILEEKLPEVVLEQHEFLISLMK